MNYRKTAVACHFGPVRTLLPALVFLWASMGPSASALAGSVRIATYNIQFLDADDRPERLAAVRGAIDAIDADIIALQEIRDRAAVEAVFDPNKWFLIIDDDDVLFSFEDNTHART